MEKLIELLQIESAEIATSFKKASIEGEGTPQEVSDRREEVVKKFFAKYFPFPFRVVKGNIVDSYGNRSQSIDCVILNPSHPYTIDPSNERASIIFADGADYVIEIKPDLANKEEIERALRQIQSVKKLKRVRHGLLGKHDSATIENAKRIPSFIYADVTYVECRTLIKHIVDYYVENAVPKEEEFDMIVVNNRLILFNFRKNSYITSKTAEGIYFAEMGQNTLATFLLWMNGIPKSEPDIGENIINLYLKDIPNKNLSYFEDLNKKLNSVNLSTD